MRAEARSRRSSDSAKGRCTAGEPTTDSPPAEPCFADPSAEASQPVGQKIALHRQLADLLEELLPAGSLLGLGLALTEGGRSVLQQQPLPRVDLPGVDPKPGG